MKVLFIGPLPEPTTGQSIACQVFLEQLSIYHQVETINTNKNSLKPGITSLGRIRQVLSIAWLVWVKRKHNQIIYLTISESLAGNLKDILLYLICFKQLAHMIIHLHGGAGMRTLLSAKHPFLSWLNKFFIQRIGAVIVLGERHVEIFSHMICRKKIYIVPNFASKALFLERKTIEQKFQNLSPLRLLFLSNLLPGKGHEELLAAICSLDPKIRSLLEINFAGEFESKRQKQIFLTTIQTIPQIHYHGVVTGAKKIKLFAQAHIFCLPTYYPYEGQPISILEAYASGCAVITTDHSGIFDIFCDQKNGYAVEKKSFPAIVQAIQQALAQPNKLQEFALHNQSMAQAFYQSKQYNANLLKIVDSIAID